MVFLPERHSFAPALDLPAVTKPVDALTWGDINTTLYDPTMRRFLTREVTPGDRLWRLGQRGCLFEDQLGEGGIHPTYGPVLIIGGGQGTFDPVSVFIGHQVGGQIVDLHVEVKDPLMAEIILRKLGLFSEPLTVNEARRRWWFSGGY